MDNILLILLAALVNRLVFFFSIGKNDAHYQSPLPTASATVKTLDKASEGKNHGYVMFSCELSILFIRTQRE